MLDIIVLIRHVAYFLRCKSGGMAVLSMCIAMSFTMVINASVYEIAFSLCSPYLLDNQTRKCVNQTNERNPFVWLLTMSFFARSNGLQSSMANTSSY